MNLNNNLRSVALDVLVDELIRIPVQLFAGMTNEQIKQEVQKSQQYHELRYKGTCTITFGEHSVVVCHKKTAFGQSYFCDIARQYKSDITFREKNGQQYGIIIFTTE